MPDPIAKCWACLGRSKGHYPLALNAHLGRYEVQCMYPPCQTYGPKRSTHDDAIAAWNAVAALYRWTDTGEETPV